MSSSSVSLPLQPLSRQSSRVSTHYPRIQSPPPKPVPNGRKLSFLARLKKSSSGMEGYSTDEDKSSGGWRKKSSKNVNVQPTRREESEELDWERIRTLPRVRLIPPDEDECEPVMLYPVPHPSSLLPLPKPVHSPPTLLSATVAATSVSTDPSPFAASFEPPKIASTPEGVVPNSLAHAQFMAQQHDSWVGMSDKFIKPPPIFARPNLSGGHDSDPDSPTSPSRRGSGIPKGVIMPKTRRQVEADIGKRMSMNQSRKRQSLEIERNALLPPLEEATQSPPNVMMPPLREEYFSDGDLVDYDIQQIGGIGNSNENENEDDKPLAVLHQRKRPTSPPLLLPLTQVLDAAEAEFRRSTEQQNRHSALQLSGLTDVSQSDEHTKAPILEELSHKEQPLPNPFPRKSVESSSPTPMPMPAFDSTEVTKKDEKQSNGTRGQRSKSLSAALSRSKSDDGPSTSTTAPPLPPLRKQKSLKKLFFGSNDEDSMEPIPDLPAKEEMEEKKNQKKSLMSRVKSKPSLKIDVSKPQTTSSTGSLPTPALITGSSTTSFADSQISSYPLTPDTQTFPIKEKEKVEKAPKSRPALSKRFSLSNMSAAFKKKPSISGGLPSLQPVVNPSVGNGIGGDIPDVPALPDIYKKGATHPSKNLPPKKDKGKGKATAEEILTERPELIRRGYSVEVIRQNDSQVIIENKRKMSAHPILQSATYSHNGAGPSGLDISEKEELPIINSPSPINTPILTPDIGQGEIPKLLPALDVHSPTSRSKGRENGEEYQSDLDTFNSPLRSTEGDVEEIALSTESHQFSLEEDIELGEDYNSSVGSLADLADLIGGDEESEKASILHAQMINVTPKGKSISRFNDGEISIHKFLGSKEIIREGSSVSANSEVDGKKDILVKGSGNGRRSEEIQMVQPFVIDLRGQYLQRVLSPPPQDRNDLNSFDEISPLILDTPLPTDSASAAPQNSEEVSVPVQPGSLLVDSPKESLESLTRSSESEPTFENMPTTPSILALQQALDTVEAYQLQDTSAELIDLSSEDQLNYLAELQDQNPQRRMELQQQALEMEYETASLFAESNESGIIIVDSPSTVPLPLSSILLNTAELSPIALMTETGSNISGNNGKGGSNKSTPKSRFSTPEALLRLLTSPRQTASRMAKSSPQSVESKKDKKEPISIDGLPIRRSSRVPANVDGVDGLGNTMSSGMWISNGKDGMGGVGSGSAFALTDSPIANNQLDSLHFDSLGLDLSFGFEMKAEERTIVSV